MARVVQRQDPTPAAESAPAPAAAVAPAPRTELEARYNGNFPLAAAAVTRLWDSAGGIVSRQQQAVTQFIGPGGAGREDQPSFAETVIIGALQTALGLALGGIGGAVIARLGQTIRAAALAGAIRGETSGAVPAEVVGAAARLAQEYVKTTVDYGKAKALSYSGSALRGNLPAGTPLTQFGQGQLATLNEVAIEQGEQLLQQLANAPDREKWVVAQGLYDALRTSLATAATEQLNAMTDVWLTAQVTSVGQGARPGVLNIELEDVYADHRGALRIASANLLGSGANDTLRGWVAGRPLEEIGIPKVVTMNGSLGMGVLDCIYTLKLWSAPAPTGGQTLGAADPLGRYMAGGPARLQGISNNRWGDDWLAAYHLGLQDIDGDDPRVNPANTVAGAQKVWDNIKGASIGSRGASVDASSW